MGQRESQHRLACLVLAVGLASLSNVSVAATLRARLPDIKFHPACGADRACAIWARYRAQRPFPFQTIAAAISGGKLVLLVTEPPPSIEKKELAQLVRRSFGSDLVSYATDRWMVGVDGWVEDVVVSARWHGAVTQNAILDDPATRDRIALLYRRLYGTVYGAHLDDAAAPYVKSALNSAPNLTPRPGEIHDWLRDTGRSWLPIANTGPAESLEHLASRAASGPFMSTDNRLVLYLLPKTLLDAAKQDADVLNPLQTGFRKFALASDVVLGGVTINNEVVLVARARVTSLASLPPLRFETFKLLTSVEKNQLEQSYERNNFLAGRLRSGPFRGRDWAPIYLSTALIDTEFGSLLNVTDQLLKSWSQAGRTHYVYFDYPLRPDSAKFVFGGEPLSVKMAKATGGQGTLFNWNTAGLAVDVNFENMDVISARHTSALPVTYGSDVGKSGAMKTGRDLPIVMGFEDSAYNYFAARQDPNLARVVSYTSLYQTFRTASQRPESDNQGISIDHPPARANANEILVKVAANIVEKLPTDLSQVEGHLRTQENVQQVESSIQMLRAFYEAYPQYKTDPEGFARLLLDPGSAQDAEPFHGLFGTAQKYAAAKDAAAFTRLVEPFLFFIEDLETARAGYVKANAGEPQGWIKTPSIVLSWDESDAYSVGGHNLLSHVPRIEFDPSVTSVEITETAVGPRVIANPQYKAALDAKAPDVARMLDHEHIRDPAIIVKFLEEGVLPTRTMSESLGQPIVADSAALAGPMQPVAGVHPPVQSELFDLMNATTANAAVVRDARGYQVLAYRELKTKQIKCCTLFKDTVSLSDRLHAINRDAGGRASIVFSGENPTRVDALGQSIGLAGERNATLEALAGGIGGGDGKPPINGATVSLLGPDGKEPYRITFLGVDAQDYGKAHIMATRPRDFAKAIQIDHSGNDARLLLAKLEHDAPSRLPHRSGVAHVIELQFGDHTRTTPETIAYVTTRLESNSAVGEAVAINDGIKASKTHPPHSLAQFMARLRTFVSKQAALKGNLPNMVMYVTDGHLKFRVANSRIQGAVSAG